MKLIAPPGYAAVVPFDKEIHGQLGVPDEGRYQFASRLNAVYVTCTEFVQSARHYPVVFSCDENKSNFTPMVVTSLQSGSNVFTDEKGDWASDTYIPAYVRRYPFCIAEIKPEDDGLPQQLVCVDESALSEEAESLYEHGEPSESWTTFQTFMGEYESARVATQLFTDALLEHDLLEIFEAQAYHTSGQHYHMTNMYRVKEAKFKKLPAKVLKMFMEKNYMYFIYAHLMSLDNFQRLLDRS